MPSFFTSMKFYALLMVFGVCVCTSGALAQEDEFKLNIFGYTAVKFAAYTPNNEPLLNGQGKVRNTFSNFQTGVFLSGSVASDWKYLVELQIQNDFTFQQLVGQNFLHQAWIEWRPSDAFGLRMGTSLAPFGYFNVIHSRPSLYWIIERPVVYQEEELVGGIELVRSEFANLMASGVLRLGDDAKLDYAVHVGNTDRRGHFSFDLSAAKQLGSRIALRTEAITFGISGAANVIEAVDSVAQSNKSIVAGDLQVRLGNLSLLSEVILVGKTFEAVPESSGFRRANYEADHTHLSAFALVGYDITEQWLAFVGFDYFNDQESGSRFKASAPFSRARVGVNFKPHPQVLIKGEVNAYLHNTAALQPYQSLNLSTVLSF